MNEQKGIFSKEKNFKTHCLFVSWDVTITLELAELFRFVLQVHWK